jgi:hypothetical protein
MCLPLGHYTAGPGKPEFPMKQVLIVPCALAAWVGSAHAHVTPEQGTAPVFAVRTAHLAQP